MKKNNKPVFLLFFLFLLVNQNHYCQGQNNIPDLSRQRFQNYLEAVPLEEVFIHTDKDEYISGEGLWFAAYLIDRQSFKPSSSSRIVYFELINPENRPVAQKRIYLENGFGPGQITLSDTLSTGTYTIRAYTNSMKNFLPENCFIRDIRIFNPFDNKMIIDTSGNAPTDLVFDSKGELVCSKYIYTPLIDTLAVSVKSGDNYGVREKVIVDLEAAISLQNKLKSGSISVSVSPLTKFSQRADIMDYLISGSGFGFERSDKIPDYTYRMEKEFHFLRGKLTAEDKPSNSSDYVLLCIPGKEPDFQYAKTDSSGYFSFNIRIDTGIKDLVLMPDKENRIQKIIIEPGFSEQPAPVKIGSGTSEIPIPQYITDWSVNYQVSKIYGVSSSLSTTASDLQPLSPVRFYGKPDVELFMADYVALPEMEEVFYELLPNVSMKKRDSGHAILITDRINENRYESSPALFLDGVKINDASVIKGLDPSIVERIDVVKEKYFVGNYSFPGLVNITTNTSDFSIISLPDYMIRFPYRVIDPVRSFFSPDYSSADQKNSNIPDFRNTLYWNPSVKPDKEGRVRFDFWTSDFVSEYQINVQGITSDGEIISVCKTFRVE